MDHQLRAVWAVLLIIGAVIGGALIGFTTWRLQPKAPAAAFGAGVGGFFSTALLLFGLQAFLSVS